MRDLSTKSPIGLPAIYRLQSRDHAGHLPLQKAWWCANRWRNYSKKHAGISLQSYKPWLCFIVGTVPWRLHANSSVYTLLLAEIWSSEEWDWRGPGAYLLYHVLQARAAAHALTFENQGSFWECTLRDMRQDTFYTLSKAPPGRQLYSFSRHTCAMDCTKDEGVLVKVYMSN